MAYTARDAVNTFLDYINKKKYDVEFIDGTSERGIKLNDGDEDVVIFIYPISHKADDTKNFLDTRDSGAKERAVAWRYAANFGLKYFCVAVHEEVPRYKNYIFSLECNESIIEKVSGTLDGKRNGSGTQVVIPNDFAPQKPIERIKTKNNFFIAAVRKEKFYDYMRIFDNRPYMHKYDMDIILNIEEVDNQTKEDDIKKIDRPYQRIFFGAPGTGKSYQLNEEAKKYFGENYERVTFHPNYMYGSFVGTYKPTMEDCNVNLDEKTKWIVNVLRDKDKTDQEKYDELYDTFNNDGNITRLPILLGLCTNGDFKSRKRDGEYSSNDNSVEKNHGKAIRNYVDLLGKNSDSRIVYKYVPGPFMRIYVRAMKSLESSNPEPFLLIIEEINRANVAAVFGDVFQLLDRSKEGDSEYPIQVSEDIKRFLAEELGGEPDDYSSIKIPSNMYIWATMNSADQGVMPMDTAFRRRWDFKYLGIDEAAEENKDDFRKYKFKISKNSNETILWDDFRRALNKKLSLLLIPEDKLIGPYFVSKTVLDDNDLDQLTETIKNKVLMYLYEDAAKPIRPSLFAECKFATYSILCDNFDKNALTIFKGGLDIKQDRSDNISEKIDTLDENTENEEQ